MESDTEDLGAGSSQMCCCLFFKDKKNHWPYGREIGISLQDEVEDTLMLIVKAGSELEVTPLTYCCSTVSMSFGPSKVNHV
jgi:hypothetical protein